MTSGALRHPHIVRTIQVGVAPKGDIAYIAMDLIEGESLADLLARVGRLHPEESCSLLFPIASALAHAHVSGIIHRDVKPSNILLRPASYGNKNSVQIESLEYPVVPLLSDFGIARSLDSPELTNQGRTVGTPAYMAPEQCAGSRDIDGRADVYALGTVLFRCVAGRPPFSGTTTQILHAHVYEPITIDDETLSRLPPLIVDIFRQSLAKQPEERYADAKEMAIALAITAGRELPEEFLPQGNEPGNSSSGALATSTMTMSSLSSVRRTPVPKKRKVLVPGSSSTKALSASSQSGNNSQQSAQPVTFAQRLESFKWGNLAFAGMAALISAVFTALLFIGFANYRAGNNGGAINENSASAQTATATWLAGAAITETETIEPTMPPSPTLTETATESPSPTASETATVEPTSTVVIIPTSTPTEIPVATEVPTLAPSLTSTLTPTSIFTDTLTPTFTATISTTSTLTPTLTPAITRTPPTATWTPIPE